ncbi:MAG: hypothetical protein MH204_03905, partial [Fimbriimonadaceae bacterium]|nr:hypothetical protein [Fimbriimonadaceae bacterium]
VAAACLLTGDPTRTLQGAQIAAGLRAEAARQDHRKAQGFSPGPDGPPADLTLEALFGRTMPTQGWTRLLGSPLWQLAGPPIWVEQDEQGWLLSFLATETRPVDLRLHSWQVYRLEPGPGIGQTVELPTSEEQVRGHRLVPTRTGLVQARIRFQAPATRFPRTVPGLR